MSCIAVLVWRVAEGRPADQHFRLQTSYLFKEDSMIGRLLVVKQENAPPGGATIAGAGGGGNTAGVFLPYRGVNFPAASYKYKNPLLY